MQTSRLSVSTASSTENLASTDSEPLKNQAPGKAESESPTQSSFAGLRPRPFQNSEKQAQQKPAGTGMPDEVTRAVLPTAPSVRPSGLPATPRAYRSAVAPAQIPDELIKMGRAQDWVTADKLLADTPFSTKPIGLPSRPNMHKGGNNANPSMPPVAQTPPGIASTMRPRGDADTQPPVETVSVSRRGFRDRLMLKKGPTVNFDMVTPRAPSTSPGPSPIDWDDEEAW